ncbi:MarR family winged helix-turn-helix transcriptional regulator [Agromyces aerolatus]|uniref:MarR family winged helix-turn-helix transcriptional regulator n=1 Tax=Agromyces sp. LY-1074 TaxID=3074080 RepID=UPI00285A0BD4|nr:MULTISPECIES: MarR family transcriptional regulator [unclassified Agromyces]MDR5699495.1 MarR family transcriptional regulator [Agromyces sp. LY-1074]MDR5705791.1 MarR family transcriptional regulator [Agromyces sp. LY-1358]
MTAATADPAVDEAIALVEEQLSVVFTRARQLWKQAAEQIHPDLQPAGYKVLATIVRLEATNAHVLADLLDMDKSSVSRQVRVLEEAGFVESRPDERDGRLRVLAPTPVAVERIRAVRERHQARVRRVLEDRAPEELVAFAGMLRLIADAPDE